MKFTELSMILKYFITLILCRGNTHLLSNCCFQESAPTTDMCGGRHLIFWCSTSHSYKVKKRDTPQTVILLIQLGVTLPLTQAPHTTACMNQFPPSLFSFTLSCRAFTCISPRLVPTQRVLPSLLQLRHEMDWVWWCTRAGCGLGCKYPTKAPVSEFQR